MYEPLGSGDATLTLIVIRLTRAARRHGGEYVSSLACALALRFIIDDQGSILANLTAG
jgi:hypothetical protein